jgi:hypothetical protein
VARTSSSQQQHSTQIKNKKQNLACAPVRPEDELVKLTIDHFGL